MTNNKVVFAQNLNFITFLILLWERRKINKVILHETYSYSDNITPKAFDVGVIWRKLGGWLFSKIEFEVVPECLMNSNTTFEANEESLKYYEAEQWEEISGWARRYLKKKLGSNHGVLALKNTLLELVKRRLLFYLQSRDLEKMYGEELVYIIPSEIDYFHAQSYVGFYSDKFVNFFLPIFKVKDCLTTLAILAEILLRPWIELFKNGIILFRPKPVSYDFGHHVTAGFDTPAFQDFKKMKISRTDDILRRRLAEKGDFSFLHVFGVWSFTETVSKSFKDHIENVGANYAYEHRNKIPALYYVKKYLVFFSFSLFINILAQLIGNFFSANALILAIRRILLYAVTFELFNQHFRVKVFVSKDDYAFYGCIRTIIQNKYGLKNTAISHSLCTYTKFLPGASFVNFDAYFVRGNKYQQIFYPHWEPLRCAGQLVTVGQVDSDLAWEAKHNKVRQKDFQGKYGKFVNVLVPISIPSWRKFRHDMLERKYKHLPDILELDDRIHLILRPRSIDAVDYFFKTFPKYSKSSKNKRLTVETDDFTTYELMAYCDIAIGEEQSGIIMESLCVNGAWPIVYALRLHQFPLSEYSVPLIAHNIDEIKILIQRFLKKEIGYSYTDLSKVKEDFAPYNDCDSWRRIVDNLIVLMKGG